MRCEIEKCVSRWKWKSLHFKSGEIKSIKGELPNAPGVYILRAPSELPRVEGCSNIVYIGKSGTLKGTKQGLQGRVFNTRGSAEKWVRKNIEKKFSGEIFILDFCVLVGVDPKKVEEELLRAYLKVHGELPPANHQSVEVEEQHV